MRFIVWGINYAPEVTGIAPCNTALCRFLDTRGHDVRMVTSFSYYPEWTKRPEDRWRLFRQDRLAGVAVDRCWHYVPAKPTAFRRMLHEFTFVATSFLRLLTLPAPDAYVVVSPPLLLGAAAWLISLWKRAPFVFHVQDLQPDAAASMGMLRGGPLLRLLYGLEALAYRQAPRVTGITPGMVAAFEKKGVPPVKTLLFPNGITLPASEVMVASGRFRKRLGLSSEKLLAVYAGNLGVKHGVEVLLEAAGLVQDEPIHLVICGDGARRTVLEQLVARRRLRNVTLLPLQPEPAYHEMLADMDVYLVTQQPGSGSLFFPSKLLTGLAFAKPALIVADAESELTRAGREGGFAVVIDPSRVDQLAGALRSLALDAGQRRRLGEAGRRYASKFEWDRLLRDFEGALCQVAGDGRQLVPPFPLNPARSSTETAP